MYVLFINVCRSSLLQLKSRRLQMALEQFIKQTWEYKKRFNQSRLKNKKKKKSNYFELTHCKQKNLRKKRKIIMRLLKLSKQNKVINNLFHFSSQPARVASIEGGFYSSFIKDLNSKIEVCLLKLEIMIYSLKFRMRFIQNRFWNWGLFSKI